MSDNLSSLACIPAILDRSPRTRLLPVSSKRRSTKPCEDYAVIFVRFQIRSSLTAGEDHPSASLGYARPPLPCSWRMTGFSLHFPVRLENLSSLAICLSFHASCCIDETWCVQDAPSCSLTPPKRAHSMQIAVVDFRRGSLWSCGASLWSFLDLVQHIDT